MSVFALLLFANFVQFQLYGFRTNGIVGGMIPKLAFINQYGLRHIPLAFQTVEYRSAYAASGAVLENEARRLFGLFHDCRNIVLFGNILPNRGIAVTLRLVCFFRP